jgi:hypothetical protein
MKPRIHKKMRTCDEKDTALKEIILSMIRKSLIIHNQCIKENKHTGHIIWSQYVDSYFGFLHAKYDRPSATFSLWISDGEIEEDKS